jgi:FkbM family methyltransferase
MEKHQIRQLINTNNPVIFEIGAADGTDTLEFINTFNDLDFKIYCFEPDLRNIQSFKQKVNDPRVTLFEMAIGDKNGKATFNQSNDIYNLSSSLKKPVMENMKATWPLMDFDKTYEVDVVTLDAFLSDNNIDKVDFIWADVQGAEDLMILGGKESLINKVRYMYTEYSNVEYYENELNLNEIIELMGENWEVVQVFTADVLLRNKNL